jgi:diphthamide synthase subunit DPH2
VFVSCPETSLIDFKTFNMHVATPHEFFMALMPEVFPWESRILTDFNQLLPKLSKEEVKSSESQIIAEDESSLALV